MPFSCRHFFASQSALRKYRAEEIKSLESWPFFFTELESYLSWRSHPLKKNELATIALS